MPRYDDPLDERDDPQSVDMDFDDDLEEEMIQCPACGHSAWAELDECPDCGEPLDHRVAASRARQWGWPAVVAVLIAIVLAMWVGLNLR